VPMKKRMGALTLTVTDKSLLYNLNSIISFYSRLVHSGVSSPHPDDDSIIISFIVEGLLEELEELADTIRKLEGIKVRAAYGRLREEIPEEEIKATYEEMAKIVDNIQIEDELFNAMFEADITEYEIFVEEKIENDK
jgi:hypothetical protein